MIAAVALAVVCSNAQGVAFPIGAGQWVTAAHVAQHVPCQIAGQRAWLIRYSADDDVAVLYSRVVVYPFSLACVPMTPGRTYRAVDVPLFALHQADAGGLVTFLGRLRPGHSGAPIIGSYGLVYGIVTRHSPARGRPVRDTMLCGGRA